MTKTNLSTIHGVEFMIFQFDIWIQHIKTVGKHSHLVLHMLTQTRN